MSLSPNVLLVEDDQDVCDAVSEALEDAGFHVNAAANGAVALSALQSSAELPCLVLLDLMMPVMDGEHFLEQARRDPRLSMLPVVLMTADGHATAKATSLGVLAGLKKPVTLEDLLSAVSKHCVFARGSKP